jgi:hypothetical protein
MVIWTRNERLTFDIAFALKKVTIPGFRQALKQEDRFAIAATILEHLKLDPSNEDFGNMGSDQR